MAQLWLSVSPETDRNNKKQFSSRRNFSHWASQKCQNQGSFYPPFREKYDYFLHYWGYFWLEIGQCHKLKGQNQNLTCTHNNSWSTSCGKIMVPALSNFANIDHKGYFRKMLTQTFKSGCFSWNHTYVL